MPRSLLACAVAALFVCALAPAQAADCAIATAPRASDIHAVWPKHEALLLELRPTDGKPLHWSGFFAWAGFTSLPGIAIDSTPAAYAGELFVARAPYASLPRLQDLFAMANLSVDTAGPFHLSAPAGAPASYRMRKNLQLVLRERDAKTHAEVDVVKVQTHYALEVTGLPGTSQDGRKPLRLTLSWQQIAGWLREFQPIASSAASKTGRKAKSQPAKPLPAHETDAITKTPLMLSAQAIACLDLAPGEMLIVAGTQSLGVKEDGVSEDYQEIALVVRALE